LESQEKIVSSTLNKIASTRDVKFDEARKFDPKSPYAEDELLDAIDEPTFLIEVPNIQET
jgi:hypothetical protein